MDLNQFDYIIIVVRLLVVSGLLFAYVAGFQSALLLNLMYFLDI